MFTRFSKTKLAATPRGMLVAFIGFTAFAFSDVASKWLTTAYPTYQIVFLNHAAALLFLLALMPFWGNFSALMKPKKLPVHLLRGFLNTGVAISATYSFAILPIADAYTFIFAMPLFAALMSLLLYGQKICTNRMLAIIIGFAGIFIAMRPGASGFDIALLIPVLCSILIALKFTVSRSLEGENIIALGLWPFLVSVPIAGMLAMSEFALPPLEHLFIHLFNGAMIATGLTCVSQAFRMAPAAAVSPVLYTEMIWALVMGYLIFSDVPDLWMMVGAGIIILSGLYLVETERRNGRGNVKVKSENT